MQLENTIYFSRYKESLLPEVGDDIITSLTKTKEIQRCIEYFPIFRPLDHTMGFSLDKYVNQRLPGKIIEYAVAHGMHINIIGACPQHSNLLIKKLRIQNFQEYIFLIHNANKQLNYMRPRYFLCNNHNSKHLMIFVTPGSDYIIHYASMIRHQLSLLSNNGAQLLSITRYPDLENNICLWTGLDSRVVRLGDLVVLGYVDEMQCYLEKHFNLSRITVFENQYYRSIRYQIGKLSLNFLGVKYSFWGNISSSIVHKSCELGAVEIIYIAKLGSLTSPADLYTKVYSASRYLLMKSTTVIKYIQNIENPLIKLFPELDSGCNVSVPTVLEEDFEQRDVAVRLYKATSIDNEISQMASAISEFNSYNHASVRFFNLHFATDYVRSKNEKTLKTLFDLSNNRTPDALSRKKTSLQNIANYFIHYISLISR